MRALLFAVVVALAACATAGDEEIETTTDTAAAEVTSCPTAPIGTPTYLFWHTTRQLEHLVWASDGQSTRT